MGEPLAYWASVCAIYDEAKKHCRDLEKINSAFVECRRMMEDYCALQAFAETLQEKIKEERESHARLMAAKDRKIEYYRAQARLWSL